jgi:AraC-like DNA-binding protein
MAETGGGNRTCELAEDWAKAARENDHHGHPRMFDVARHLRLHCSDRAQTSLERLAQVAHLSPSRLMHVFTRFFGIPLRAYVRQLRVDRAVNALAAGHSVTEAAYIAGFADASHLTRTVRRTFGVTPRQVLAFAPLQVSTHGMGRPDTIASSFKTVNSTAVRIERDGPTDGVDHGRIERHRPRADATARR